MLNFFFIRYTDVYNKYLYNCKCITHLKYLNFNKYLVNKYYKNYL